MIKFAFLSLVLAFAGLTAASAFNSPVDTPLSKKEKKRKPNGPVREQEDESKEELPIDEDEGEE